ncbi:MAG: phenylalanine--tRNA ligase subunit beta [Elusimicrobia bacterium]|nr:phenylalanine--tRNA ligase subunit beta [Elusimicrobiota bacterium]
MRYLLSWIEEFLPQPLPSVDKTIEALEQVGLSVAAVDQHPITFQGVVIGEVQEVWPHPNADRLRMARVSDGAKTYQVVCGAPNLAQNQKVAFAPIGARLKPGGQDLLIERRKIRNSESEGMICSSKELGLGDDHDGILVLPKDWTLGAPLDKYIRPETILDIELPFHRWDLTSHLGLARELAVYFWRACALEKFSGLPASAQDTVSVTITEDAAEACGRYEGLLLTGCQVKPSPWWIQRRLELLGLKAINNVVDATNYVTLEMGQPLHAFDWATIRGPRIEVRRAKQGEKLKALNAREYELLSSDLVIADAERPVALAGVIGGEETGVTGATKDIFFECAWFSRSAVRPAARRLGLRTESSSRFEKETDIAALPAALGRVLELIQNSGGATVRSVTSVYPKPPAPAKIEFSPSVVGKILGLELGADELFSVLTPLCEETKKVSADEWVVIPRSHRGDLRLVEDVAEEALRYLGFSRVPGQEGYQARIPALTNLPDELKRGNRELSAHFCDTFRGVGFHEAANYPLCGEKEINELCGESVLEKTARLANPVSADLSCLRPSLLIGLYRNWLANKNHPRQRVFLQETGYVHGRGDQAGPEPFVSESIWAAIAFGSMVEPNWLRQEKSPVGFWEMVGLVEGALGQLRISFERGETQDAFAAFHPGKRLAWLSCGKVIGCAAELATDESLDSKTNFPLAYAQINLDALGDCCRGIPELRFKAIPILGLIQKDLAVLVDEHIPWSSIEASVRQALGPLLEQIRPFDVYASPKLGKNKKSVALRLSLRPKEKTPTQEEIQSWLEKAVGALKRDVGAELRA